MTWRVPRPTIPADIKFTRQYRVSLGKRVTDVTTGGTMGVGFNNNSTNRTAAIEAKSYVLEGP
jgi:hypothetical protein